MATDRTVWFWLRKLIADRLLWWAFRVEPSRDRRLAIFGALSDELGSFAPSPDPREGST